MSTEGPSPFIRPGEIYNRLRLELLFEYFVCCGPCSSSINTLLLGLASGSEALDNDRMCLTTIQYIRPDVSAPRQTRPIEIARNPRTLDVKISFPCQSLTQNTLQ